MAVEYGERDDSIFRTLGKRAVGGALGFGEDWGK